MASYETTGIAIQYTWLPQPPARGWICPQCGAIYAPGFPECYRCNSRGYPATDAASSFRMTVTPPPVEPGKR